MNAQIYTPFPDSNVMWTDRIYDPSCNNINLLCSINQYTITGDTLINGKLYKKITNSGYYITQNNAYIYYLLYAGAIRQEINNKKVFYFPPYGYPQVDTLLYNFNLQVGDSLPYTYLYPENLCNAVVDSIDSVDVGNTYRKRFHISTTDTPPGQETWLIEGIGCSRGLFGYYCPGWEHWQELTCFIQNDTMIYPFDNTDCDLITFISEPNKILKSILIFPNPVSTNLTIKCLYNAENTDIDIYDYLGRKQFQSSGGVQNSNLEINVMDWPEGVYIVKVMTAYQILKLEKIIVSKKE